MMRRRSTSAPLAPLLCAALALPACAQRLPPFLQPAEPDCEMDKVTAILHVCDTGTGPSNFASRQRPRRRFYRIATN